MEEIKEIAVGDGVIIGRQETLSKFRWVVPEMLKYANKKAKITHILGNVFRIDLDKGYCFWQVEGFSRVFSLNNTIDIDEYKKGDGYV